MTLARAGRCTCRHLFCTFPKSCRFQKYTYNAYRWSIWRKWDKSIHDQQQQLVYQSMSASGFAPQLKRAHGMGQLANWNTHMDWGPFCGIVYNDGWGRNSRHWRKPNPEVVLVRNSIAWDRPKEKYPRLISVCSRQHFLSCHSHLGALGDSLLSCPRTLRVQWKLDFMMSPS